MAIKKAKTLSKTQFKDFTRFLSKREDRLKCLTIIAFSFKAGLRAQEIAGIRWQDVCDAEGNLLPAGTTISLPSNITKGDAGGAIVIHRMIYGCLVALAAHSGKQGTIIKGVKGKPMTPNSVAQFMKRLYESAGFMGCSSHSGRRTFITNLARTCNIMDCSLADVQKLARHRHLKTTEAYVDLSGKLTKLAGMA